MIKRFCDCCGNEVKSDRGMRWFSYGVHLCDIVHGKIGGYVDADMNSISGRNESWEVCSGCYNRIMIPSVKKFFALRQEALDSGKLK